MEEVMVSMQESTPDPAKRPKVEKGIRYYLFRHGETDYSKASRYCGWEDAKLTEIGYKHHEAQIAVLRDTPLEAIYSSDSTRCLNLAEALARPRKMVIHKEKGLRELDFGIFGGMTYGEAYKAYPKELAQWVEDPVANSPPRGETLKVLWSRLQGAMEAIERQVQGVPGRGLAPRNVALVTHGGVIRLLLCDWLGIPLQYHWRFRIDPGSLTIVERYTEGAICCLANYRPDF
jgi:broad specificity phosphatase PhoE